MNSLPENQKKSHTVTLHNRRLLELDGVADVRGFDENAVLGEPSVPDGFGYSVLYQDGMSFKTALCGKINVVGNMAQIYRTNFEENDVWLKARFYDSNGNIVGESGLIRPGEYVKCVELTKTAKATETYKIKIMSYEPNTYNSLGAITINPRIVVEQ